jgi:hypothetical protein
MGSRPITNRTTASRRNEQVMAFTAARQAVEHEDLPRLQLPAPTARHLSTTPEPAVH